MAWLLAAALVIGIYILYFKGIRPLLDNWNNEETIKKHYEEME